MTRQSAGTGDDEQAFARQVEEEVRSSASVEQVDHDPASSSLIVTDHRGTWRVDLLTPFRQYHERRAEVVREIGRRFRADPASVSRPATDPAAEPEPVSSGPTIETPATAAQFPGGAAEVSLIGEKVASIRIVEKLGTGGFGDVYLGIDESLGRRVAVKALRQDRCHPENRARHAREAQILSRLNHPNICQIYELIEGEDTDGGPRQRAGDLAGDRAGDRAAPRGHDLLILEYVRGKKLSDRIGTLSREEKQRIAEQLAEVLVVAHSLSIVHRDLKPANLIVTDDGQLKVLDFGLARLAEVDLRSTCRLDARDPEQPAMPLVEEMTEVGTILGTVGYMSPEQARGEVATPACDLYALGLILQQLFTGELPYDREFPIQELVSRTARGESRPVRGVGRSLRRLTERLKSPRPDDRPPAAEVLGRLREIRTAPARRLRLAVVTAAVLLGIAGATKYTVDLRREREAAITARNDAEATRAEVEELMVFMLEDLYRGLEPLGRLDLLDRVANKTLDYYGRAHPAPALGDETTYQQAVALTNAATVLHMRGDFDSAIGSLRQARDLAEVHLTRSPDDPLWLQQMFIIDHKIGFMCRRQGDLEQAIESFRSAESYFGRLPPSRQEGPKARFQFATTLASLGTAYSWLGRLDEALEVYNRGRILLETMVEQEPGDGESWFVLASIYDGIGDALRYEGSLEEGIGYFSRSIAAYLRAEDLDPTNLESVFGRTAAIGRLGETLQAAGRHREAEVAFAMALENAQHLVDQEPADLGWQQELAVAHARLAGLFVDHGREDEAEEQLGLAIAVEERLHAADPTNLEWANNLAYDLIQLGLLRQDRDSGAFAQRCWRRAVSTLGPLVETASPLPILDTYALGLLHLGQAEEARPWLQVLVDGGWNGSELYPLAEKLGVMPE